MIHLQKSSRMTISTMQPRLSTGIPGCDEILGGGLVPQHSYLLAGSPGSGKTIFSLQGVLTCLRATANG